MPPTQTDNWDYERGVSHPVTITNTGDFPGASGAPAAATIADGANVALGATTNPAATTDTENASLIALFKRLLQHATTLITAHGTDITGAAMPAGGTGLRGWLSAIWAALTGRLPAALVGGRLDVNVGNTPTVSVNNFPATQVVSGTVAVSGPLTDAQLRATAVPVSASSLPLPSGAATAALQTTGNTSLASVDGKLPASLGAKTVTNSLSIALASDIHQTQTVTRAVKTSVYTVSAGAVIVGFRNTGSANATLLGEILLPGDDRTYAARFPGVLGAISLDATGTTVEVGEIR